MRRPGKPLFEVVPRLPGFPFRIGLMEVVIPVLPTGIGLVAHIEALLRLMLVANRRRAVSPVSRV